MYASVKFFRNAGNWHSFILDKNIGKVEVSSQEKKDEKKEEKIFQRAKGQ